MVSGSLGDVFLGEDGLIHGKAFTVCDRCQKELRAFDIRYGNGYQVHGRARVKGGAK